MKIISVITLAITVIITGVLGDSTELKVRHEGIKSSISNIR
ncbi:hypothetical protein KCTCHS21_28470 [Cohnella abietis]|uniref:Uncharacterized protein n=1 Tax=Cohnella abietis TaxID=2507935 RepID=A0A3T1D5X8_9BACL|nr:hypothetical protein KCTCHS21_28470 [Cohnella abietis]